MKYIKISIVFTLVLVSVILSANGNNDTTEAVTDPTSAEPEEDVATESQEENKSQLKELCLKNANLSTFEHAMAERVKMMQCVFLNLREADVEQKANDPATSLQELRVIGGKYCSKAPQMLDCLKNYTGAVGPCFDDHKTQTAIDNFFSAAANRACLNDGEQVAQFLADRGPDCFAELAVKIKSCKTQLASNLAAIKNNTDIELNHETKEETQCEKSYRGYHRCVIQNIDCKPSAVNLLDTFFNATSSFVTCGNSTDLPIQLDFKLL